MIINYNVTGAKRKELVELISNFTGCDAIYKGTPTFAYEIDYFTVDKNGQLIFDDRADSEVIERLLEMLYDNGFEAESLPESEETEPQTEGCGLIINIPIEKVAVGNLTKLLEVKGNLIKKAFSLTELPFCIKEEYVSFRWFKELSIPPADAKAYTEFISFICEMTVKQKRITASEKVVDNEKYAFRCFLLRLGFIGKEYKESRKILLRNLEGSSAFKAGRKTKAEGTENA